MTYVYVYKYTYTMNTTLYIRKENEEKWNKIPDKSNWVNTLLENSDDTSRYGIERPTPVGPVVEVLNEEVKFCKHNAVVGFCKKGCK